MKKFYSILNVLIMSLIFGCQTDDPFVKHFGDIDYNGQKIGIIFLSHGETDSPEYKVKKSDLKEILDLFISSVNLEGNEIINSISILSDNEIHISTLNETPAEKKKRLEARSKGYFWLASRGRIFIFEKKKGCWFLKSEGQWISKKEESNQKVEVTALFARSHLT